MNILHMGYYLLVRNIGKVIISIEINRNTIDTERDSLTNFEWYFSKSFMFSYKFEDYVD